MMTDKTKATIFAVWFLLAFAVAARAEAVKGDCLVMPGHRVSNKFSADYAGERYYFCCRPCVKAFKRNPGEYFAKHLSNSK